MDTYVAAAGFGGHVNAMPEYNVAGGYHGETSETRNGNQVYAGTEVSLIDVLS